MRVLKIYFFELISTQSSYPNECVKVLDFETNFNEL